MAAHEQLGATGLGYCCPVTFLKGVTFPGPDQAFWVHILTGADTWANWTARKQWRTAAPGACFRLSRGEAALKSKSGRKRSLP